MTIIPALMSSPMVRATLREVREPGAGKSMTRRLAETIAGFTRIGTLREPQPSKWTRVKTGDLIWVRERASVDCEQIDYAADHPDRDLTGLGYRPSIFMPRRASRLTLIVTSTKIERLQDISEQDCEREGLEWNPKNERWTCPSASGPGIYAGKTAVECFQHLWSDLHGDSAWKSNHEVVAISYRPVLSNIDAMKEAA